MTVGLRLVRLAAITPSTQGDRDARAKTEPPATAIGRAIKFSDFPCRSNRWPGKRRTRRGVASELASWLTEDRLTSVDDTVRADITAFPSALLRLFSGENTGKLVLEPA